MQRLIFAGLALCVFFACDKPTDSSNSGKMQTHIWYVANDGGDMWMIESTAQAVVSIENDVITYYWKKNLDTVCFEGFRASDSMKIFEIGGETFLLNVEDTLTLQPWSGNNPPWPNLIHTPDC